MRRILGLWLSVLAAPATAQIEPPGPAAEIISTSDDAVNRMTVPVMINGAGPFNFVIDTGADRTVISRELATRLALPESGTATLHSMSGVTQVTTVKIAQLQVSTNVIRDIAAPALAARHLGADGLLGIDSLKDQRIILDFPAETMTIEPANRREVRNEPDDPGTIVVTARSRFGQLVLVDADAAGTRVAVVVDTGAQNSIGNSALRSLLHKRAPSASVKPIEMISVVGLRTAADYMIVGKMRIGGVTMGNAAIAFADAHPFRRFGLARRPALLLGMEGLRAFRRVSIDFANRRVKFSLPPATGVAASD